MMEILYDHPEPKKIRIIRRDKNLIYVVGFHVKDRAFVEEFAKALREMELNPRIYRERKGFYSLHAWGANFYDWYKSFCSDDGSPDTERFKAFVHGFEEHVVRGFYESKGSVSIHTSGNLRVRMANKRAKLLEMIRDMLCSWGIDARMYPSHFNNCYSLSVYGTKQVNKLLKIINPCIKTKPRSINREKR